jgi:acetyl esterase
MSSASYARMTLRIAVVAGCAALAAVYAAHVAAKQSGDNGTAFRSNHDMGELLDTLAGLGGRPVETLAPAQARVQPTPADAAAALLRREGKGADPARLVKDVHSVDGSLPGPAGALAIRTYTPAGTGPFPVIVYFPGGGWVLGGRDAYDGSARGLSRWAHAVVVSVDTRRAPEAKFPAQHDDALAAWTWVSDHAAALGGDPRRLALAGESAGGNLALATAVAARDRKLARPAAVLAIYPVVQFVNDETPSYIDSATARPLNKATLAWFRQQAFAGPRDLTDPRADVLRNDLHGLPPVTLINARIDPLRSDGDLLAQALRRAGVAVDHRVYDGVTHGFFGLAEVVGDARSAQARAGEDLKAAFRKVRG